MKTNAMVFGPSAKSADCADLYAACQQLLISDRQACWVCDTTGETVFLNPALRLLLRGESRSRLSFVLRAAVEAAVRRQEHTAGLRFTLDDGRALHATASLTPLLSASGKAAGYLIRLSEISWKSGDIDFRQAVEVLPQVIWSSLPDGSTDYLNKRWTELTGIDAQDSLAWAWKDAVHPEDLPRVMENWRRSVATATKFEAELRFRTANGSYRWHLACAVPSVAADGRVARWFGTNADIHELREAQASLKYAMAKFQRIFNVEMIGLFFWNASQVAVDGNDAFLKILGFTREDLLAGRISKDTVVPLAARAQIEELAERLRREKTVPPSEQQLLRKDGTVVPVMMGSSLVTELPGIDGLSFIMDLTERKKVEAEREQLRISARAALEASELKSHFLATISHEIRTPLNAVIGISDLLMNTNLTPEQLDFAEIIKTSADNLSSLISDLLDYSRIEADRISIDCVSLDLTRFLLEIEHEWSWLATRENLDFKIHFPREERIVLRGDPLRLRQIINNLLSNAVKYTPSGSVELSVDAISIEPGVRRVRVEVRDTGIGIEAGALGRIFDPFFQVTGPARRGCAGVGLGLSICRRLAEKMGGELTVSSTPGAGSSFMFTCKFEDGDPALLVKEAVKPVNKFAPGLRVLVGEDVEMNQRVIRILLSSLGLKADVVGDGGQVLDALKRREYDLLLLDCSMPEMDGYTCARKIKEDARWRKLPIIAMTANVSAENRVRCMASGMTGFLGKPVRRTDLAIAIHEHGLQSAVLPPTLSLDIELKRDLARLLPETGERYLSALRRAVEQNNAELIARQAHALKSAVCYFGADELIVACQKMETSPRSVANESLVQMLDEVTSRYQALLDSLQIQTGG